jgi:hypothetical protein
VVLRGARQVRRGSGPNWLLFYAFAVLGAEMVFLAVDAALGILCHAMPRLASSAMGSYLPLRFGTAPSAAPPLIPRRWSCRSSH